MELLIKMRSRRAHDSNSFCKVMCSNFKVKETLILNLYELYLDKIDNHAQI